MSKEISRGAKFYNESPESSDRQLKHQVQAGTGSQGHLKIIQPFSFSNNF
jgi:hypothetical protein